MLLRMAHRRTSAVTVAAAALAALMLLLTVQTASAQMSLSGVSPDTVPTAGGPIITIAGSDLPASCPSPAVTVTVGGVPASLAAVVTETEIKVFAPAHAAGAVDILVEDNCTDDEDVLVGELAYVDAPLVIGISPETGLEEGGTVVSVFGNDFVDGATVMFGDVAATAVTFVSEHQLDATTPAGTGTVDVTVTNPDDQIDTLADAFTYAADETGEGEILSGSIPASGFGLIVFGGGTNEQLVEASGCPEATATFYATNSSGGFVTYIPGSGVAVVNAAWNTMFEEGIPALTPLAGKCV
jgi:hypothetical protein